MQPKRIAITTAVGILTGAWCSASLLVMAPPGITPEPWFMLMIFYCRVLQGAVIGFADDIPLSPILRGAVLGALFSLLLCIVPFFAHNYFGAAMLLLFGILYGILADGIASRVVRQGPAHPAISKGSLR